MRRLLILILLVPTLTLSQKVTTTEFGGANNIYNDGIKRYLILSVQNKKHNQDTFYVQQDNVITDSLMTRIYGSKVVVADSSVIEEKLRQNGSFMLHKLFPLSFDKGVFYVSLVLFSVTKTNGEVYFANTATFKLEYLFYTRMKAFQFTKGRSYGH
ncbi:hypothetical protein [Segetibacter aerophilus]|nr:hypothetical protein [Segetibacter aerophilus]